MQTLTPKLAVLLSVFCIITFQSCKEPIKSKLSEDKTSMHSIIFENSSRNPTELNVGELLRWHDPEEDEVVLCFKLDLNGQSNYGEFIVILDEFDWSDLGTISKFSLTEDDLASSDMSLSNYYTFSRVEIAINNFSDSEDIIQSRITGTAVDENKVSHDFKLSSEFHIVRPKKHAKHWQQRLEEAVADYYPKHTVINHFTLDSEYGLRYGDDYFSDFRTVDGDRILIQSIFDSSESCELYVAVPNDPTIDEEDRRFSLSEKGLERMRLYINKDRR